ncbi:hypothetical protein [Burkholderia ambifaria]|uniref:Uncharacterized protein n=1 Tax=Burkholderia ambifaria MEX-5 TaxID=396597 RepID=B1T791_9BURK|nr:hypothetical protein [Burkholderia ambifaria]EDT40573.1 conserved hypothetical protein [Burkholderia ambifaria MEX-5]
MIDANPNSTFRRLPLTLEQDAEIRHYIKRKSQKGEPWDTTELVTMLRDMLDPPPNDDEEPEADIEETKLACAYALASVDEAMESDEMKRPRQ